MTNVCKNTQGNTPIKIYVLHGYTDGLTDPIVSTVSVGRFSPFRVGLKTPISVNLKSPMHHVCY